MPSFAKRLHDQVCAKKTSALVGLDPRLDQLPKAIVEAAFARNANSQLAAASAFEEFCSRVIDVVAPLVPAVKPQAAFFEELGPEGVAALARVNRKAREAGLIVICDVKRGDIGTTAEAYARAYLAGEDPAAAPFSADALTVNPYLGSDTLEPFVQRAEQCGGGVYVLVRTSNPGAGAFQDVAADGKLLYQRVAGVVEQLAERTRTDDVYGCVGAVVGATYPREIVELRAAMPHAPLLIPGYGSQGGSAADVAAAHDARGLGALVNNSRGINFAFRREPYASRFGEENWEAAVEEATRAMIADLANSVPMAGTGGVC